MSPSTLVLTLQNWNFEMVIFTNKKHAEVKFKYRLLNTEAFVL